MMDTLQLTPQHTHPQHPLARERRRRKRAEQAEQELITIAFTMSLLLFVSVGVLLIATGRM